MSDDIRAHAEKRLKDRRQFWASTITLVLVFAILVVIWAFTGAGYFWPMWPGFAFIIAIAFHALNVFGPLGRPISSDAIDREVRRLGGDSGAGA